LWPPDGEGATDTDHGEIVIAGAGVCQGYLGRPELNAARFVEVRERCWYRSGDLAERDEWGLLRYQGRLDEQVKVQGYRIELGEIEAVLRGVPGIKDCAAIVESGPAGGRIVVFCVSELSEGEVSTLVKARSVEYLPRYMHPRRVKVVSELHYTGSGKVDKRTLRQ
jgi:acyl-CoA synthetase (AMP-forming)/AMP-acid ligase II